MLRFLLLFCILSFAAGVSAQEHTVKRSADIVVIRGKSFYLHTVEAGQTLYAISRAYGVDVNELKALNDKKDNALSLYEVLRIPYVEPFVRMDKNFYYHKVQKGETIYSISRRFDIKPRRILKFNEKYGQNEPLAVDAVIRLPLNEIDRSVLAQLEKENAGTAVKPEEKAVPEVNVVKETAGNKSAEVKPEEKKKDLPVNEQGKKDEAKEQEVLVVGSGDEHVGEMPPFISDVVMLGEPYVKVALLLPFYAHEYPAVSDTLNTPVYTSLSSRSEQFVYFYEGVLLAIDSLKNKGYKIDLQVYDTEKNPERMYPVVRELNSWRPDLIIGPVYGSVSRAVIENLENKNTPVIYPLSARGENLGQYPNFIQVNTSFPMLANKMAGWISGQSANANVIYIELPGGNNDEDKRLFAQKMRQLDGVQFFQWDFEGTPLADLKLLLLPDRENILILPTAREAEVSKVLPALGAYADGYKVTVVGFPEWQTFTSVDHEAYFKLNTKIFTYSYVDNNTQAAHDFAVKFRNYFYTEPNNLAFKAYDMGLYFIGLAAKYRDRTLDAIEYYHQDGEFSRFGFSRVYNGQGKENQALYIVNFGSDYQLKLENLK